MILFKFKKPFSSSEWQKVLEGRENTSGREKKREEEGLKEQKREVERGWDSKREW